MGSNVTPNTLLYIPFENSANDSSGKPRTITTSGITYTTVSGVLSAHVGTSGGAIITSPYPLQPDNTKPLTISVLINVGSLITSARRNIIEFACTNGNRIFFVISEGTSDIKFQISSGDTTLVSMITSLIGTNQWIHLVATVSNTESKLYVNGNVVITTNGTNIPRGKRPYSRDNKQAIMSRRDGDYNMGLQGNMRELIMEEQIWNDAQVSSYYSRIKHKLGI